MKHTLLLTLRCLLTALDVSSCPKLTTRSSEKASLDIDITHLLSYEQFENIKKFVLDQGQTMTYCNMYNNNPYYQFGAIELFLNPIMQFPDSSSISNPNIYNVIVLKMWNPPQDYQFLYTDITCDKKTLLTNLKERICKKSPRKRCMAQKALA